MDRSMKMWGLALAGVFAAVVAGQAAEVIFRDDFAGPELEGRRASRGEWQIADGVARCTQDDALYKQFKDHGPILMYDVPTTDATVCFGFRAEGVKTLVFTLNGEEGHVFRFVMSEGGTSFRAFPPEGEVHSTSAHRAPEWVLPQGEWTAVEVVVTGSKVVVTVGDHAPVEVEDPSYARARTNLTVGYSFGTLEVRDLVVER